MEKTLSLTPTAALVAELVAAEAIPEYVEGSDFAVVSAGAADVSVSWASVVGFGSTEESGFVSSFVDIFSEFN